MLLEGSVSGLERQYTVNAVVFVSGIRTDTRDFSLDLKGVTVNPTLKTIQIDAFSNAAIEFLEISYIIYDVNAPFTINILFNNLELVPEANYGFIGVNQFTTSLVNFLGFTIDSRDLLCRGSGCTSLCVHPDLCQKLGGVIINS